MTNSIYNLAQPRIDAADVVLVKHAILVGTGMAGDALDEDRRPVLHGFGAEDVPQRVEPAIFQVAVCRLAQRLESRRQPVVRTLNQRPRVGRAEHVAGDLAQRHGQPNRGNRLGPQGATAPHAGLAAAVIDPSTVKVQHGAAQAGQVCVTESAVAREQDARAELHVGLVQQRGDFVGRERYGVAGVLALGAVAAELGARRLAEVAVCRKLADEPVGLQPVERRADVGDVLTQPVDAELDLPRLMNAGEVERPQVTERRLRRHHGHEPLKGVVVLVKGPLFQASGGNCLTLGVDELVEQVFDAGVHGRRGRARLAARPQFVEPRFVQPVCVLARRRFALAGDQSPRAVDRLVPAAADVTGQAVRWGFDRHRCCAPCCARRRIVRACRVQSTVTDGLQIRYSWVRIPLRPVHKHPEKTGLKHTSRVTVRQVLPTGDTRHQSPFFSDTGHSQQCAAVRGAVREIGGVA